MNIKTILTDKDFVDFMTNASNMKIDIFEIIEDEKAFGIKRSKLRINYDKVISNSHIYDDCYLSYKKAFQSLKDLYASYATEYDKIDFQLVNFVVNDREKSFLKTKKY